MANRVFAQFSYGLEKMPVTLYLQATIGSAGAITLSSPNSLYNKGIASIVLGTTGKYTITLQDAYTRFLDLNVNVTNATGIPVSPTLGIVSTGTNVAATAGGTVVIQFSSAGTATNLASGDVVNLSLTLSNSTAA